MNFKIFKQLAVFTLATALVSGIYVYGVKLLEKSGLELYHRIIIRNLVQSHEKILQGNELLLGMYRPELPYQFGQLYTVQDSLGLQIKVVSYYQAWGDGDEYSFKLDVNRNLAKGGFVPLVTWEPWVSAFGAYKNRNVDSSLALIASGEFDGYIRTWARGAVLYGKPFFVRPGHEMSNNWYSWSSAHGNSPAIFKKFWRHVHDIFEQEGARNAAFVWNPYTAADTVYYPGSDCVDWIGLDIFNFGSLSQEGTWLDFYTVTKLFYDAVKKYEKPILIAETGCAAGGGNKNDWYRNMFHILAVRNFPLVKGIVLFDTPHATTPTGIPVDLGFSSDNSMYSLFNKKELAGLFPVQTLKSKGNK
jgi:hypothetical protein